MGKKSKRRANKQGGGSQRHEQQQEHRELVAARRQNVLLAAKSPREKADEWMAVVNEIEGDPWNSKRLTAFFAYTKLMRNEVDDDHPDGLALLTKEDKRFIRKFAFASPKKEPAIYRSKAMIAFGWINLVHDLDFTDAVQSLHHVVAICDSACDMERLRVIKPWRDFPKVESSVGEILDTLKEDVEDGWLSSMRQKGKPCRRNADGSFQVVELLPGDECDYCHKKIYKESNKSNGMMNCCSRCHLTFYCSEECQRGDMVSGRHKALCRKRGEFRVGDSAITTVPFGSVQRKGLVKIRALATDDEGVEISNSFVVSALRNAEDLHTLPAKSLRRLRPALWDDCDQDQTTGPLLSNWFGPC